MYHPLTYNQLHVHEKSKRQQTAEIDYGDNFLFAIGMILFPVGLSWVLGGRTVSPGRVLKYSAHRSLALRDL